jgi:hypothetical protein
VVIAAPTKEPTPVSELPPIDTRPVDDEQRPPPATGGRTQVEIARRLDDEGSELYRAQNYAEASSRFRNAVARVPEATYFFHLCRSLYAEGKFSEAMTACDAVLRNSPTADLERLTKIQLDAIRNEAKKQQIQLQP